MEVPQRTWEENDQKVRQGSAALSQTVADTHLCEEIFRFGRVLFDFAANIGHVDAKNLIIASGPGSPQFLDNEIVSEDFSRVFTQKRYDAELAEGQLDVLTADQSLMLVVVDGEVSHRISALLGDLIVVVSANSSSVPKGLVR